MLLFFSGSKSKNSDLKMGSGGFSQNMTAILQHATAEKRAGDGMLFFSISNLIIYLLA